MRGVGCFVRVWDRPNSYDEKFPSPCGVWVVSMWPTKLLGRCDLVSVPLRGVGCFEADRMEIQGEKLMVYSRGRLVYVADLGQIMLAKLTPGREDGNGLRTNRD